MTTPVTMRWVCLVRKVRDLRSLYGFRLLLKKKNAEYKKVIGSKPEDEQSRLIMWNVLDPESKRLAASDGVSGITAISSARY